MKRFNSSDSLAALISVSEVKDQKANQGYSKEFQAMLDSLEEEDYAEEGSHIIGKKRRLTLDQVKALEKNFEVENKLEPERKLKLAEELGLQPRQVAIWFQNRRARWKIKKMEREYGNLKANYEALKLDYNNLEKENETLVLELKELKAKLREENAESGQSVKVKEEYPLSESENNVSGQSQNHDFNENNYSNEIIAEHINASSAHGLMNWIQLSDPLTILGNGCQAYHQPHHVKVEELNLFSTEDSCNFFSVDQAPTLHWYFPEQQN